MKTKMITLCTAAFFLINCLTTTAQNKKQTITVLNLESLGVDADATQLGNLARLEIEKLNQFEVTDKHDVNYVLEKNQINANNCFGKICLLEIGKIVKSDLMLTGSIEAYANFLVVTLRLIDVQQGVVLKTNIDEFNNYPLELQAMIKIGIGELFEKEIDQELKTLLSKKYDYENTINNPNKSKVNLSGPRFGYAFISGAAADALKRPNEKGGYDVNPAFFQFGYQFEKQYLNEGNCQALLEIIPSISGVDQQFFLPSITLLNGFRYTKNGLEIAFGPSFSVTNKLAGAYVDGAFLSEKELQSQNISNYQLEKRIDSRGKTQLSTALVVALGRSFKSGKMNIPVNFFATVPTKDGFRFGFSLGYNAKNKP